MLSFVFARMLYLVRLMLFRREWRKCNRENNTVAGTIFPLGLVEVGKQSYGQLNISSFSNPKERLKIGSFCSIAGGVRFILGGEHRTTGLSTFPFKKYICGVAEDTLSRGPIIIEDDVWIGEGAMILSGVTIGQGAIIAAGSVVTKDVPPYAVFAAGKVKKFRFDEETLGRLKCFDFSELTFEAIRTNIDFLYSDIKKETVDSDLKNLILGQRI